MVTNGLYATGGRMIYTDVSNRVVLDKALTVMSMNGYSSTIIQGAWDPATNGPAATRCAWLTNGATLAGFTLQGGATRAYPCGALCIRFIQWGCGVVLVGCLPWWRTA